MYNLKEVSYCYPDGESIFKPFSDTIHTGEYIVLMGENGSGKSTFLDLLSGFSTPSQGEILFEEQSIKLWQKHSISKKQFYAHLGIMFQEVDHQLFNNTVYDEIAFGPRQMGLTKNEVAIRVKDCLELLQIEPITARIPYQLSGGEKKKVAFASILAMNPDIYLLDEPFNGLTKDAENLLKKILNDLHQIGKTILISSHNFRSFVDEDVSILLFDHTIKRYSKQDVVNDIPLYNRLFLY